MAEVWVKRELLTADTSLRESLQQTRLCAAIYTLSLKTVQVLLLSLHPV